MSSISMPVLKDVNGDIIELNDYVKSKYTGHILQLRFQKIQIDGVDAVCDSNDQLNDYFYALCFLGKEIEDYILDSDDIEDYMRFIDDINIGNTEEWAIKLKKEEG